MMERMFRFTDRDDNFLITAPTYKILQQSTLPTFLKFVGGFGEVSKVDAVFRMFGGGTCYFRTETDPDSIVGIPNVRHIWGDEAGKYRLYFWENIQARADAMGCTIDLTTSPYAMNWIYRELVKPAQEGKRSDVELIQAASWENPYHSFYDPAKRKARQATMDPRRFSMQYGGEWGQMAGLVFDCWDDTENTIEAFQLPPGTIFVGGVDWGYTEPFVHIVRAITPDGRHYQISEFYKSGMTPMQILELIVQRTKVFGIKRHWCGHDEPGMIEELNRRGVVAQQADFDITRGNGLHYELIKTRKYKIFKGTSPHTQDEYSMYHYPEPDDPGPDDDAREQKPVGQFDHAMSANRFITIHEYRTGERKKAAVPEETKEQETQEERLRRLMRPRHRDTFEKWS